MIPSGTQYNFMRIWVVIYILVALSWDAPIPSRGSKFLPICEIQGSDSSSPFLEKTIRTRGLVFADLDETARRGFFLQAVACDDDPSTSDGIFVYLGMHGDVVQSGDQIELTGIVKEYYGMTEISTTTNDVKVLSANNPFPPPQILNPPFDVQASRDYFETLEGMYVQLDEALVVGPTDEDDRTWLVRADLGITRVYVDDPQGTGEVVCVDDGGLFEITPEAKVGDRLQGLAGALDYTYGVFCLQLISEPRPAPPNKLNRTIHFDLQGTSIWNNINWQAGAQQTSRSFIFDLATFNLANLFDAYDDPATEDSVLSATEYQRRLEKRALAIHETLNEPAILAVQEIENLAVLQALISRPEIHSPYAILSEDSPDKRGIDIALLYHTDRVQLLNYQVRQGCTTLTDGLGPDGNGDMANPHNALTCDTNNDGTLDGNRLFSRPPLVAHLQVCSHGCTKHIQDDGGESGEAIDIQLIINHWKSRLEDTATTQYTLLRRIEQADFIAALASEILTAQPGVPLVLLGDLNANTGSQPISILTAQGFSDLLTLVEKPGRYTYIYQGISQGPDHVLIRLPPQIIPVSIDPIHINADYPAASAGINGTYYRSSDHDPLLVKFSKFEYLIYLPTLLVSY